MEMEHDDTDVLNAMLDLEPPFVKTSSYAYDVPVHCRAGASSLEVGAQEGPTHNSTKARHIR